MHPSGVGVWADAARRRALWMLRNATVYVGDVPVPKELWGRVRPKPGASVVVHVIPDGDIGSILLSVVGFTAAAFVPAFGPMIGTASVGQVLARAAVSVAAPLPPARLRP